MHFTTMDLLNFQYLDKMNNNIGILRYDGEAALRGEPRMQSIPMSSAISNHRTGPPPISPIKRKYNGDQGEDDVDCDNEHVSKMSRLFAAQLQPAKFQRPKAFLWEDAGLSSCFLAMIKVRLRKAFQRDYRKDHGDRSRSPVERVAAPTMSIHPNHMYAPTIPSLAMDQPLALTKNSMDAARTVGISPTVSPIERQQNRPSVITCASASNQTATFLTVPLPIVAVSHATASNYRRPSNTNTACDPVIEEHFRRSLGKNYKEPEPVTNSVSITGSVDDHFAKALGETWLQIKAAKDGVSSSPESASRRGQSPPSSHMVNHNHSPSVVS
ncbi:transcription cofactor vestigial-like protein 4 isoform X1 [Acipenser oxyrinchus oxyrinchus]|uniref:Transcription cofactor vestigial-like protein 4 isoform X1 n=1 Tax=Acipenser oxyrinchus oxyrinchus TaxID=40147 RepID=A0AAD8CEU0_ACIOX|nr:transcription cofactor vestigial-like protein 4 isoform X1 [Acipenser oxyrinchus oxyrinchus]